MTSLMLDTKQELTNGGKCSLCCSVAKRMCFLVLFLTSSVVSHCITKTVVVQGSIPLLEC